MLQYYEALAIMHAQSWMVHLLASNEAESSALAKNNLSGTRERTKSLEKIKPVLSFRPGIPTLVDEYSNSPNIKFAWFRRRKIDVTF
jgi:hypothetical protein